MKILIVINDHITYRTYISTNAFGKIIKNNCLTYAVNTSGGNDNLKKIKKKNKDYIVFKVNQKNDTLIFKISSLHFFSNIKKSLSYWYRYKRLLNFDILYNSNLGFFKKYFLFLKKLTSKSGLWLIFILPLISTRFMRNFFYYKYLNKIEIPNEIERFFKNNSNEEIVVIAPSSGVDFFSISLDKLKKKFKSIKDIILINNWDNVSSKGAFWHQPNAVVVWGNQTEKQAKRILGIKKNIYKLGTPSYLRFFSQRKKKIKKIYNFDYALLAGPALPFDEISLLKNLDEVIVKKKLNLKIVYRPHPHRYERNSKDNFYDENFTNVVLDHDARNYYKKSKKNIVKNFTDLDYYPSLIKNAKFLVAPLSTMLIEGLIFYKKILVILHNDNFHYTTPKRNFENFEHLKILKNFDQISFSHNNLDLEKNFYNISKVYKKINKNKYDSFLEKILINPINYDKNLFKIVSSI